MSTLFFFQTFAVNSEHFMHWVIWGHRLSTHIKDMLVRKKS